MDMPVEKAHMWSYRVLQSLPGSTWLYPNPLHPLQQSFTPVVKFMWMHIVLALAAINNWEVHQVDIKNAYLNIKLTKRVYMAQPPGFIQAGGGDKVCRLFKALYGLKQGGRCWYL